MCVIIHKPAVAKLPAFDTLCRCARLNPHGFGFCTPNRVFKSLSFDDFLSAVYEEDESLPMLIHMRWATHGSIKKANCHPFIDPQNGLVFCHNGVLDVSPIGGRTDSETAFKWLLSPAFDRFGFGRDFTKAVELVRGCSRFAFMNGQGEVRLYGDFIRYEGCQYSNSRFLY